MLSLREHLHLGGGVNWIELKLSNASKLCGGHRGRNYRHAASNGTPILSPPPRNCENPLSQQVAAALLEKLGEPVTAYMQMQMGQESWGLVNPYL